MPARSGTLRGAATGAERAEMGVRRGLPVVELDRTRTKRALDHGDSCSSSISTITKRWDANRRQHVTHVEVEICVHVGGGGAGTVAEPDPPRHLNQLLTSRARGQALLCFGDRLEVPQLARKSAKRRSTSVREGNHGMSGART
jgi:hypothetical protein